VRLTKAQAADLAAQINPKRAIAEFIAGQGWAPLGYATFTAWWTDTMAEITIPPEFRVVVVYQMLAERTPADDIAAVVRGIGPAIVASLARQREHGVPAEYASR
jgi:hypothetical protein